MLVGDFCFLDLRPTEEDAVFFFTPMPVMIPETRVGMMSILEVGALGRFVPRTNWKHYELDLAETALIRST